LIPRGPESPILLSEFERMTDKEHIKDLVEEFITGTGIFLVAVKVSSTNRITVLADKNDGITIDECAALHRHLESGLHREEEDFELQVSSPGLDMPFTVIEQYYKNQGRKVEVTGHDGNKFRGELRNVTSGGFELMTEVKGKGKAKETSEISFNFEQVKATRAILTIR
jgi:ribosome maturation factor RimP